MHRLLLLLFLCFTGLGYAQTIVLEDFEGDSDITWEAINGTYNGVVANPEDSTGANSSANVGSYTKSEENAYSLFVGNFADSLDLSTNNRFTIQVNAGAATSFIMKLEGAGTAAVEMTKNIATPNVWRTYTFDFSSATTAFRAGRVILFFDPGVEASADTYLFDNLTVRPAGPCAGTVADATVIDDFECQRNATYGAGFDSLMVIANPDKSGINTSDSVGQYTDENGAFAALVVDYNAPIDLSTNNQVCVKVWAPVAGNLTIKLEGGAQGTDVERGTQLTETGQWVEVCQRFDDVAGNGYTRIAIFFNFGVDGTAGDVYYIDDITITPSPPQEAIEDFEDGARLDWGPANDNAALNGTFTVIANPDTEGNESENVGSYVRGTANFATLTAALPDGLDLSGNPQLNLDVWAPEANTVVTLQLTSATVAGPIIATATVTEAMSWQTLSFNFADFAAVTDFDRINLRFAPETTGTGTYYFDNLIQGQGTVEACLDVEPDPSILDDFECQRNVPYTIGSEFLSVVDNPAGGQGSPNPSSRVGAFRDQPGAFNALVIDLDSAGLDLSLRNQFSATVWAPAEGRLLFKLEGGTGDDVERYVDIDTTNAWSTYTADFSEAADGDYSRLVLFFGAGENNTAEATYYIDNIRLTRAAYASSCIANFENEDFTVDNWSYFVNGSLTDADFMIVDNPDTTGINTSARVGVFEEAADGEETYAGLAATLEAPVALPTDNKVVTMKVWMPVATTVVFKLEQGDAEPAQTGDIVADYTTPNEWQELTFNMSETPDGARYNRITIIMNNQEIPATDQTYYFDDIAVGGGDCSNITSLFEPITVEGLRVYPNPITDRLTIENPLGATRFTLTNMLGQQLQQLNVSGARTQVQWELSELPTGTYLLTAQDRSGQLVARSMVVKR
ncbi:T9SS type A sorting domain-containing protein [Neolewinella sp.]|uniref:T9SS type A sorting domain-containing protein n=1 Tax=Neolewinella sp. TaxID=2993543 RepID=UPI003B526DFC